MIGGKNMKKLMKVTALLMAAAMTLTACGGRQRVQRQAKTQRRLRRKARRKARLRLQRNKEDESGLCDGRCAGR